MENLRQENLLALRRKRSIADLERERSEGNLQALTVSFAREKAQLERRVEELNEQIRRLTAMHEYERDDTDIETTSDEEEAEVSGQTSPTGNATAAMSESAALVSTMAKLLKTQTEAIQAQTQVAAAQHLPPLKSFTGEDMQEEEGTFDRWLELFEERAKLTCWGPAQRLHHLKLLLEKTALKAFRTFEVTDREDYDKATAALCKRFKLVDIEELRGLEFHHRMQGKETIEELGMDLQTLGRKAFPSSHGKEFDRLLKGRFFQAIHVKWQRKLGAPKTGETFQELFDRARVLEQHEKQYTESAVLKGETPSWSDNGEYQHQYGNRTYEEKSVSFRFVPNSEHICYTCKQTGLMSRNCPQLGRQKEALGQSSKGTVKFSRNAVLKSKESHPMESEEGTEMLVSPTDLSTQQLQDLLTQRQLQGEQTLLKSGANIVGANTVSALEKGDLHAVGPTVHLSVKIGGVPVEAMVDTGSQSTIISRSLLHEIGRLRKGKGESLPVLERPTARLFGKDGESGGRELTITAQVQVEIEADGECVCVPVFVQPQSEQCCLLGMNVLPALGLDITRANGESLITKNPEGTAVCLDEGVNVGVVRCITDCFEVRNYNGVEECNGVSSSSLVSCEVLGEESLSLSDSVEGEVSSEELSSGSVVGEKSKRNIVGEESEKVVEDSAVCRSSETTPECAAKLMESFELPREKVQQTQKVQQYDKKVKNQNCVWVHELWCICKVKCKVKL